ncbi:sn-1-specific diacylglycerol lipase ABHD11-like isoform X1 [Styela clava]
MSSLRLRQLAIWSNKLCKIQKRNLSLAYNIIHEGDSTKAPMLMIHGLLGNKFNFNSVGKILKEKLPSTTILSCDVRNHGESPHSDMMDYKSMSEDTIQLLNSMNIDKCILLGHSLGGRIAMYTALTQQNRVEELIVVDVAPGDKGIKRGISEGPIKYVEAMKLVKFEPGIKPSQARASAHQQLESTIPEKYLRDFALTNMIETTKGSFGWRLNLDSISQHAKDFYFLGNEDDFTPYTGRTLFLGGALSKYILPNDYPDIKRLFTNSDIQHIPDCGHWVHADNPKEFASRVSNFLGGS